jgi:hypothetical protein
LSTALAYYKVINTKKKGKLKKIAMQYKKNIFFLRNHNSIKAKELACSISVVGTSC